MRAITIRQCPGRKSLSEIDDALSVHHRLHKRPIAVVPAQRHPTRLLLLLLHQADVVAFRAKGLLRSDLLRATSREGIQGEFSRKKQSWMTSALGSAKHALQTGRHRPTRHDILDWAGDFSKETLVFSRRECASRRRIFPPLPPLFFFVQALRGCMRLGSEASVIVAGLVSPKQLPATDAG